MLRYTVKGRAKAYLDPCQNQVQLGGRNCALHRDFTVRAQEHWNCQPGQEKEAALGLAAFASSGSLEAIWEHPPLLDTLASGDTGVNAWTGADYTALASLPPPRCFCYAVASQLYLQEEAHCRDEHLRGQGRLVGGDRKATPQVGEPPALHAAGSRPLAGLCKTLRGKTCFTRKETGLGHLGPGGVSAELPWP